MKPATPPAGSRTVAPAHAPPRNKVSLFLFWQLPSRSKIKKTSKNKKFFFEKKNQKTFAPLREVVTRPLAKNYQSFFASFCSQKEVLSFFLFFKIIFPFLRLESYLFCSQKEDSSLDPNKPIQRRRPAARKHPCQRRMGQPQMRRQRALGDRGDIHGRRQIPRLE